MTSETMTAIGLMSGTSLDGVDAALLETDGRAVVRPGASLTRAYDAPFRSGLRAVLGRDPETDPLPPDLERQLTEHHAEAVRALLDRAGIAPERIEVIGFHGQTVLHRPDRGITRQIGDADLLARRTGVPVVADLRLDDVAQGGEGAPLAPVYHRALAGPLDRPLAVLNLGGVGNVTWIGSGGPDDEDADLLAFDTGPGNALLDDWVKAVTGAEMDVDGALARAGRIDAAALETLMASTFFDRPPPKSLDRDDFDLGTVAGLPTADGAATLTAFTVAAVARAAAFFPAPVQRWLVTGGGRRNPALMSGLRGALRAPVDPVEQAGWDGDALEAEAFAYLAVRSLKGLPITFPGTTGASRPLTGGRVFPGGAETAA